jgi:hypothetical protein
LAKRRSEAEDQTKQVETLEDWYGTDGAKRELDGEELVDAVSIIPKSDDRNIYRVFTRARTGLVHSDRASASYGEDPNEEEYRTPGATAAKRAALKESTEGRSWHSSITDAAVELVETYVQQSRKVVIYSDFLSACDVAQVALNEVGINTCELNGNIFVPRNGSRS